MYSLIQPSGPSDPKPKMVFTQERKDKAPKELPALVIMYSIMYIIAWSVGYIEHYAVTVI